MPKQAVNDVLAQLERLKYLTWSPRPDDGRARMVRLTARGRRLEAAMRDAGRDVERAWRERIGEPEWLGSEGARRARACGHRRDDHR